MRKKTNLRLANLGPAPSKGIPLSLKNCGTDPMPSGPIPLKRNKKYIPLKCFHQYKQVKLII